MGSSPSFQIKNSLPYGDGYTVSGNDWDQYHFAGMDQDTSSNDHAMFRGYSNMAGRWMSPDPYDGSYDPSNPQSFNRYAYVLNSPLSFLDPLGLQCETFSLTQVRYSEDGGKTWGAVQYYDFVTVCTGDGSGGPGGGGGTGGGRGGGGGGWQKNYTKTIPCTSSANEVMNTVETNFGLFGDYSRWGGMESVVFSPPSSIGIGSTIPIWVQTGVVPWNLSVNVAAISPQSMTFTTNPGHVLYPASITFSASPAGQGSINFDISVSGTVANPLFYLGGQQFENAQWNNFLDQVSSFCKQQ